MHIDLNITLLPSINIHREDVSLVNEFLGGEDEWWRVRACQLILAGRAPRRSVLPSHSILINIALERAEHAETDRVTSPSSPSTLLELILSSPLSA